MMGRGRFVVSNTVRNTAILPVPIPYQKLSEINLDYVLQGIISELNDVPYDEHFKQYQDARDNVLQQYQALVRSLLFFNNQIFANKDCHGALFRVMQMVYPKKRILFSVDIEAYELSHDIVSEIGISIYDPRAHYKANRFQDTALIKKVHIIIKENMHFRNGRYVRDNQDNFLGGPSYILPLKEAVMTLQLLVNYYFPEKLSSSKSASFGVSLVGHDIKGDIKWLTLLGVKLPSYIINGGNYPKSQYIIDTQKLWKCTFGDKYSSLGKILNFFDIPQAYLHNGGNDCLFTLILLLVITDPSIRILKNFDKINQHYLPEEISFGQSKNSSSSSLSSNGSSNNNNGNSAIPSYTCDENDVARALYETYQSFICQYVSQSLVSHTNIHPNVEIPSVGKAIEAIFRGYC